jgi:hypothetical protein
VLESAWLPYRWAIEPSIGYQRHDRPLPRGEVLHMALRHDALDAIGSPAKFEKTYQRRNCERTTGSHRTGREWEVGLRV